MTTLKSIVHRYLKEYADFQPVWALVQGVEGYEGKVIDLSEERVQRHRAHLEQSQKDLKKTAIFLPPSIEWLERTLLKSEIALRKYEWGEEGKYRRNPTLYVGELVYGLWYLFLRVPSKKTKVSACLDRLNRSGEILTFAKQNLTEPPALWTKIAIEELKGYQQFLKVIRKELLVLAPSRRSDILKAINCAEKVAEEFLRFLRGPLKKRSVGKISVGEKRFNFLLKNYHHYSLNASWLLRMGINHLEEIREALEQQARVIDSQTPWPKLINRIKQACPKKRELLDSYRGEVRKLKSFMKKRGLVSIPGGEKLKVIETPVFTRNTIPYAAYVNPPMFSGKNEGTFFVTPVTVKDKNKAKELLQEHNFNSLRVTALHEGYPGHHLQFSKQKLAKGTMPRIFNCSSFYEGWALYCEEMMYEQGYFGEETRLLQLRDKLWRACRVIVDIGLHTETLTDEEAVDFLVRETKMSKVAARADVNWYTMYPTIPQSYLTGMLKIQWLRDKYKEKAGDQFSLNKFHDDLLQFGAIPIPLVEQMIL